jgi:hypothetical protein
VETAIQRRHRFHVRQSACHPAGDDIMNVHLGLTPIISLLAGILILVVPRLLNYIVALYLIIIGLVGLFGTGALHLN